MNFFRKVFEFFWSQTWIVFLRITFVESKEWEQKVIDHQLLSLNQFAINLTSKKSDWSIIDMNQQRGKLSWPCIFYSKKIKWNCIKVSWCPYYAWKLWKTKQQTLTLCCSRSFWEFTKDLSYDNEVKLVSEHRGYDGISIQCIIEFSKSWRIKWNTTTEDQMKLEMWTKIDNEYHQNTIGCVSCKVFALFYRQKRCFPEIWIIYVDFIQSRKYVFTV